MRSAENGDRRKATRTEWRSRIRKPCRRLRWCPFGILVEQFPTASQPDPREACMVYDHRCPAFEVAEQAVDDGPVCPPGGISRQP